MKPTTRMSAMTASRPATSACQRIRNPTVGLLLSSIETPGRATRHKSPCRNRGSSRCALQCVAKLTTKLESCSRPAHDRSVPADALEYLEGLPGTSLPCEQLRALVPLGDQLAAQLWLADGAAD